MRTQAAANSIARRLGFVAEELGLRVGIHLSDGSEPVGRGIGPTHAEAGIVCTLRAGDIVDNGQPLSRYMRTHAGNSPTPCSSPPRDRTSC